MLRRSVCRAMSVCLLAVVLAGTSRADLAGWWKFDEAGGTGG